MTNRVTRMLTDDEPHTTTGKAATAPPTGGHVVWVGDDRCCRNIAPDECQRLFRSFPRLVRDAGDADPMTPHSDHQGRNVL